MTYRKLFKNAMLEQNIQNLTKHGLRSQDKGFNTEGAITHVFKKADEVCVPEGDNPISDYFNNYLYCRMNSLTFQEENNPVAQICTKLRENLAEFFNVQQLKTLDPVQSDSTLQEFVRIFSEPSKDCSYLNGMETKVYRILPEETNGRRQIQISSLAKMAAKNIFEKQDDSDEHFVRESMHLRFSMLENLEINTNMISEERNKSNARLENSPQTATLKEYSGSKLPSLDIITGHVCRPCDIEFYECPVKCETLGVMSIEKDMLNMDGIQNFCQKIHSCVKESFKDIKITLKAMDSLYFVHTVRTMQEVGTFNMKATFLTNNKEIVFGHIWLCHCVENNSNFLIFILDSTILTLEAFKLSHVELLFSKNIDFSEQCYKRGDNEFEYKPYSLYPVSFEHDMSFWENEFKTFDEYLFFDVIRGVAKDSIMSVKLIDSYICKITGRKSLCYRLKFQSHDKSLSYNLSWKLQSVVRLEVASVLQITLR